MKKIPALVGLWLLFIAAPASFAAQQQMIVKIREGTTFQKKAEKRLLGGKLLLVTANPEDLRNDPTVEWAEPNFGIHGLMGQGLPHPGTLGVDKRAWGVKQIQAPDNWIEGKTGKGVIVAVLDSGVALNHPALSKRIAINKGDSPGNGRDDDGNGYIDDVTGWNFVAGNNDPTDDHGHGTHVAGVIAGDNISVAPEAMILPVKILDSSLAGTLANAVEGVHYAVKRGAKVICASWIADGYSQALYDAINEARAAGIIFVTGAGNSGLVLDQTPQYPASYDLSNVVSVAATDADDIFTSNSNYGMTVHVAAPGANIYSAVLGGKYDTFTGTSMAAAHVAGIVAIMRQGGIADVRNKLERTSDPKPNLHVAAKGRVNAYAAAHAPPFGD